MRKILLTLIIILLLVLGYTIVVNGIEIANLQLLSVEGVKQESEELKSKIEETNKMIDTDYPQEVSQLQNAKNKFDQAKKEYLEYTNASSEEQILEAKTEKTYAIEFLWTKLGVHAREEGVNLTFELVSSASGANTVNDVKFTVNGSYIAITNFVYSIENDADLNFTIKNFKLLPYDNEILQATFTVENIAVEGNTSSTQIEQSSSDTQNSTNTQSGTNTQTQSGTSTQSSTQQNTKNNTSNTSNSSTQTNTNTTKV